MRRTFFALTLFSLVFAVGCGGGDVVIKGTATMADGTKIDNGTVQFHGATATYSADIMPDGTFSPGKLRDGDGIPPGVYQITVGGVVRLEGEFRMDGLRSVYPTTVSLIADKYSDKTSSGLSIDTSKTKTIDIVLEPAR